MQRVAVVPGSFDPVTLGHVDLLRRAASLVDELHVVVTHNPAKSALLAPEQRMDLLRTVLADVPGLAVEALGAGLLVDHCRAVGATLIVKGVRSAADVEYETPMAVVNRDLAGIETVFLPAAPAVGHISSSLVRQVAALGGDVSPYVPDEVAAALGRRS